MENVEELLQNIEHSIDPSHPWLWQIGMTGDEWRAMRPAIESRPFDYPLATMAWIGRWYRDNYSRQSSEWPLPGVDAKKLWEMSGLDTERFVYRTEAGLHAWQQSIYVLGGLPLRVVSGNREGRLRKLLCSALAGETDSLDYFAENGNTSVALRGSISKRHSLYRYILDIVRGHRRGSDPTEQTFISLMLDANREALRDKFQLEWLFNNVTGSKRFHRKLRILFRPERNLSDVESSDTHHRYLHPERLAAFGLHPSELLTMRVRFKRGGTELPGYDHPFATWRKASDEQGFLSWGTNKYVSVESIPSEAFDTVEIVAREDDNKEEKTVQVFQDTDCLQLFSDKRPGQWTSRRLSGRQSVAFYSRRWEIKDTLPSETKPIAGDESNLWNRAWVNKSVTLHQTNGSAVKTFRNLASREQPMTKLWPDLIDYTDGGLVSVDRLDEDEDGDLYPVDTFQMPLIFRKCDIGILTESSEKVVERLPDLIEWKCNNGKYTEWNETDIPSFGPVKLRITTSNGRTFNIEVLYLPPFDITDPIIRDLDNHEIRYADGSIVTDSLEDITTGNPIAPSIKIRYGGADWQCDLPVWRPINRREVVIDDKLAMVPDGEIDLPYIYREHVTLRQWNEKGFSVFDCKALPSVSKIFGVSGGALRSKWLTIASNRISPRMLVDNFPWLKVSLGQKRATSDDTDLTFYHWSLTDSTKPEKIAPVGKEWESPGLKFQDGKTVDTRLRFRFPVFKPDPRHGIKWASEIECFKCAVEHGTYFFLFQLLNQLKESEVRDKISSRLDLSDPVNRQALHRFADEMNFDYYAITTPHNI